MKTTMAMALACAGLLAAAVAAPAQQAGNGFEKKSYNYAEWAKGRFSEVVTVKNPGKIIYLGGVGAEEENTDKGGVIRHLGDFDGQCHYAWDKIKRLLAKHDATLENIDKLVTYVTDIRYFFPSGKCKSQEFGNITQPAGTFLVITALAWPGMLIEIDATASTAK